MLPKIIRIVVVLHRAMIVSSIYGDLVSVCDLLIITSERPALLTSVVALFTPATYAAQIPICVRDTTFMEMIFITDGRCAASVLDSGSLSAIPV